MPDVALPDVAGKTQHVSDYVGHGQWTVVAVWSVDCPICRRELPELAFFHEDHKKKDASVLGVSIDSVRQRERVKAFIAEHGLGFPNLIGERSDVARLGAGAFQGTPTYLFFSPTGELVAQHAGSLAIADIERIVGKTRDAQSPRTQH